MGASGLRVSCTGVRDYTGWQLATAAAQAGSTGIVAVQAEYSLLDRRTEAELAPAAAHHGVGLLAAMPLARGVLTGKYREGTPADSRGASAHLAASVQTYRSPAAARVVEAVMTAAEGLGTSPVAVALAWVRDLAHDDEPTGERGRWVGGGEVVGHFHIGGVLGFGGKAVERRPVRPAPFAQEPGAVSVGHQLVGPAALLVGTGVAPGQRLE